MSTDIVAADQLKAIVQRVERLEAEIADLNADKSEIYKEARANGFDVKAIKKVVSKRKIDEHERVEQDHVFDLYWDAVHGLNLVHAHARENIEQFDANPRLIKQVVDGMQTEAGRSALIAAVDIMVDREEAKELEASDGSPSVSSSLTTREAEESVVSGSEKATVTTQGEATAPTSDERVSLPVYDRSDAAANAGGDNVERSAPRAGLAAPTSNTGEGAANTALPADGIVMESVPPAPMKRPDFAGCFPELSNAAYAQLHDEIQASGICQPIVRHGDVIIEGWDRYNISRELGFDYPVETYHGSDVLLDVIEWQRAARNFTPAQEKKIASDLAKELPHRADDIMAAFGLAEALETAE